MLSLARLRAGALAAIIVVGAAAALFYHLRIEKLDTPGLILICLMLSPFLAPIVESISWGGATLRFQVGKNADDIADLKFMVAHFLTSEELHLLESLWKNQTYTVQAGTWDYPDQKARILRLRELGFITSVKGQGFSAIERSGTPRDVRDHFSVTLIGREYLERREKAVGVTTL